MTYSRKFSYPIADSWDKITVLQNDLEKGIILDGYWDKNTNGYYIIIYDLNSNKLIKYHDQNVFPYMEVKGEVSIENTSTPIEITQYYNALTRKHIKISKIGTTPSNLYYNYDLNSTKHPIVNKSLNDDMKYFHNKQLTPGSVVRIQNQTVKVISKKTTDIADKLLGEPNSIVKLANRNMPLLEQEIPNLTRVAFDIEVKAPRGIFPIPEKALFPVHAIALYDTDDQSKMYIYGVFPTDTELRKIKQELGYLPSIETFLDEKQLLSAFFEDIVSYPIIISYNGDMFDMPYLYNRAKKLELDPPISKGLRHHHWLRTKEYHFYGSIHLDLFRFFSNNAVRLYAFSAKYNRLGLDDVAEALLNTKKLEHDLWFDEMGRAEMTAYNIRDVELTLRLTTFSNNLTFSLMIMIMRVGKITLTSVNRDSISQWILNWIGFEHSQKNLLLPSKQELREHKGDFESTADIDGKQYQGAIVFEPEAGIYWNVTVADFASLYPSVIKKFRLSYETLLCDHESCKNNPRNQVPFLSHWVCEKSQGIMSSLVGYVRDVRVKWYKPLSKQAKDTHTKQLANTIQAALKVFINASYGVFGNSSFALFCPPLAESTTAYSRHALLEAKNLAEEKGYKVLYGDTDSIFIHEIDDYGFNDIHIWSIVELGIPLGIDYNFRYLALSGRKKNYFGVTEKGEMIVKGLQVKKVNTAIFIKETFDKIKDIMVKITTQEELDQSVEKMISILRKTKHRIEKGNIDISKLARTFSIKKEFDEYSSLTPAIQIAIQEMTNENEEEYTVGVQFQGVSTKPKQCIVRTTKFKEFPKGHVHEVRFMNVNDATKYDVNWEKYIDQFKKAFIPIFDAFDLEWDVSINRIISLDKYF